MKLRYLVSLTIAGGLLLGACGGDDDDDDDGDSGSRAEATATTSGDATKASADGSPTVAAGKTAEPTKPSATTETADSIFDRIAAESITKTYQATYDVELDMQGQKQKGTAVVASKPPKLASQIKLTLPGSGDFVLTVIQDGTTTYFCSNFGLGGSCSKDNSLGSGGVYVKKAIDEARKGTDVKELPKQTIAGRTARCFETTPSTGASKSTFCLDEKDSIMLSFATGGVKMTATQVSNSVDDKLFELPYPVS